VRDDLDLFSLHLVVISGLDLESGGTWSVARRLRADIRVKSRHDSERGIGLTARTRVIPDGDPPGDDGQGKAYHGYRHAAADYRPCGMPYRRLGRNVGDEGNRQDEGEY
jgi:hypothetical protein